MKKRFRKVKLSAASLNRLQEINDIIEEYQKAGYVLTLRQLYYQLVSRDIIPNKQAEYSKLSTLLKEGRMGGIVDWDAIEDRLRKPDKPSEFDSPEQIIQAAHDQYRVERMKGQENYIEVWVEKDALSGVLKRVTSVYGIRLLVNRGYSSASSMFDSYERITEALKNNQKCHILYLGDFDPSGVDMIRDIGVRIREFLVRDYIDEYESKNSFDWDDKDQVKEIAEKWHKWHKDNFTVSPIALTEAQIKRYKPPPNPAKRSDPRAKDFIKKHGATSWEVDALKPEVLNNLLKYEIEKRINKDLFNQRLAVEKADKETIQSLIDNHL